MSVLLSIVGGLGLLTLGADLLVDGARRLALRVGVSPIVVGLTVVAFGTSTPELVVSVRAALAGNAEIAVGNVVGSNIFNVLFILGVSAALAPLVVAQQLVRVDVPLMIVVSIAAWVLALDGEVGAVEGLAFVTAIVVYTVAAVRQSRREPPAVRDEYAEAFADPAERHEPPVRTLGRVAGGLLGLVVGGGWLVSGASALAQRLGVGELVVGLTIVAYGTSLPELATSVVASLRGERDIAVGNIVGSNIFNLLAVLGVSAVVAPEGLDVPAAALAFDYPVMVFTAALCLPLFFTGQVIARWEGLLLLFYSLAYTTYVVLRSGAHPALGWFGDAALVAVLVTLVPVLVHVYRDARR